MYLILGISALNWKQQVEASANPCCSKNLLSMFSEATEATEEHDDTVVDTKSTPVYHTKKSNFPKPIIVDENIQIKLADLGNSCWDERHYSNLIQTVQYRAIEVLIEGSYGFPADLWSVGCVAFELSTGEYLFNPRESRSLSMTEDHLGLIWEVLNGIPSYVARNGNASSKYFKANGDLINIDPKNLKIWKVEDVLVDKYKWRRVDAIIFADFIQSLIEPDQDLRATASSALQKQWLC